MGYIDYLYGVLIPAAKVFNEGLPNRSRGFSAIHSAKSGTCRVKFGSKNAEKAWRRMCVDTGLKNDSELEY